MMNLFLLVWLPVILVALSSVLSKGTTKIFLQDKNPRITTLNYVLLIFALAASNLIRLPLGIENEILAWFVNLLICLVSGTLLFGLIVTIILVCKMFLRFIRINKDDERWLNTHQLD